ncbi:Flp family type IVb pilin [Halomonas sp. DP5Y7-2]|nr:Flp family type IVb pilin [Halomonas sp. DP5Y7-2]
MKKSPLFFANPLCPKAVKVAARQPQCPQHRRQRGASAIEYAVILGVVTAVIIGAFQVTAFSEGIADLKSSIESMF